MDIPVLGEHLFIFGLGLGLLALALWRFGAQRRACKNRAVRLLRPLETSQEQDSSAGIDWENTGTTLGRLSDRFGRAGLLSLEQRRHAKRAGAALVGGTSLVGTLLTTHMNSIAITIGSALLGAYLGLCLAMLVLHLRERNTQRETMFRLPLVMESLILLVESGLGIFPAIERLIQEHDRTDTDDPVVSHFAVAYQLAASGIPFSTALGLVADASHAKALRHIFVHLDISGSEGGSLVPSLRTLSEHAHQEWRLSVESRVKRLENLVVFPVFSSVIGMLLLTAAVPLVPVIELSTTLKSRTQMPSSMSEMAVTPSLHQDEKRHGSN